jgi:hypothetical protein
MDTSYLASRPSVYYLKKNLPDIIKPFTGKDFGRNLLSRAGFISTFCYCMVVVKTKSGTKFGYTS